LRQDFLICNVKLVQCNDLLLDEQPEIGYIAAVSSFYLAEGNAVEVEVKDIDFPVAPDVLGMYLPIK
jgi:hypothetical protein